MNRRKTNRETDDLEALKKKLVSAISHTMRTPLAIVKEYLSLISDEIPGQLNPEQRKIISAAKKNIDRLTQSIEQILETSCNNIINPAAVGKGGKKPAISKVSDQPKNKKDNKH